MKTFLLLALTCALTVGCTNQGNNPTREIGRDEGGQTQGTSFPGSAGAGSQATTGAVGGGRANGAPNSLGSNGGR